MRIYVVTQTEFTVLEYPQTVNPSRTVNADELLNSDYSSSFGQIDEQKAYSQSVLAYLRSELVDFANKNSKKFPRRESRGRRLTAVKGRSEKGKGLQQ